MGTIRPWKHFIETVTQSWTKNCFNEAEKEKKNTKRKEGDKLCKNSET